MKKTILTSLAIVLTVAVAFSQSFSTSGLKVTKSENTQYRAPSATYAITQSDNTTTIVTGNSISCNFGGLHADNYYSRVFDLSTDFGINEDIAISSIDFGIETASAGAGGSQPATVNIYTLVGIYEFANLTLIATQAISVDDQAETILNVPISAIIPAGSVLVVEFFTPDGQTAGNSFFIGSNALGQTGPSYIASPSGCSITEPKSISDIGFPDMHIVMTVHADPASPSVPLSNWALLVGVLLMLTFMVVRYRRRMA